MKSDDKSVYRFSIFRMINSIWNSIFSNDWIAWLFVSLTILLILAIWMTLGHTYFSDHRLVPVIDGLVFTAMFGTWGYLGYLSAKHRYFPTSRSRPITGKYALAVGIFMMTSCWGLAIYSLYLAIAKLINVI
jgi:hypothetical protein